MEHDLPYRAEYAKSSRASCRGCKNKIEKDTLRLAVLVQSPMFDGKTPNWYHYTCFFGKQRPKSPDDIQHFESLRWEDQEKIRERIATLGSVVIPKGKGKKRAAEVSAASGALVDFRIEYAKSARAICRGCEQKITKDEVRIAKKDFETEVGKKYGGQDMWHHLTCFANLRTTLGYFASGDALPGYNSLKSIDKSEVRKQLPAIKQEEEPDAKKLKQDPEESKEDKKLKAQSKLIFKYRDQLKTNLSKPELQNLMEANGQEIPVGIDRILDRLADLMAFGRLLPCRTCDGGQLVFRKYGYECSGDSSEWAKCGQVVKEPPREKLIIPEELKTKYSFLEKFKSVVSNRYIKDVQMSTIVKKEAKNDDDAGPRVQRKKPTLYQMSFIILLDNISKEKVKLEIAKLGGKVATKMSESVTAVISTIEKVEAMGARIVSAKKCNVHIVPEDFVAQVKDKTFEDVLEFIPKVAICDWGADLQKRAVEEDLKSKSLKSKSIYTLAAPKSVKMKLKGGTVVDPDSGLANSAHVYVDGGDKYTAVLGITDLQKGRNSYYKLQILQADKGKRIWLFRSWGRIGTTIGGTKLDPMDTIMEAKERFHELYEEKSGNDWFMRDHFEKVPGKLYPIDVDFESDEVDNVKINNDLPSTLPAPVQKLMKLIFNIEDMKKVMLEFELDTEKMPLGKLSKKQIMKAYSVLSELQNLISSGAAIAENRYIDASNRFYTFIPHSAGVDALPILKSGDQLKQKIEMLDNLMELEIAYNLMKSSKSGNLDEHYAKLQAEIGVLDRKSAEFGIIQEYVQNTHAATHNTYGLKISEVYTIKRQGEEKRFKPFKKLHNRQLLWHGSRITNFAGIISQGLRIAPPEAPVTGYMFGKGIYFADMVSKSANYCNTDRKNPTGLLLLCDVALGEMMELKAASYIDKLPKGKHSCKGIGETCPDPNASKKILDGIEVPLGKPVKTKAKSSLLYNEYIVYDVAQVNAKYLVQLTFDYKRA